MKGFSGFKDSPAKDTKSEDSYGGPLTKDKDGNLTTASKRVKELREKHNASPATESHFGDPHGPKKASPAKCPLVAMLAPMAIKAVAGAAMSKAAKKKEE